MPARVAAVVARAPWGTYEPGQMVAAIFRNFFPKNHAAKVGPRIPRPLILTIPPPGVAKSKRPQVHTRNCAASCVVAVAVQGRLCLPRLPAALVPAVPTTKRQWRQPAPPWTPASTGSSSVERWQSTGTGATSCQTSAGPAASTHPATIHLDFCFTDPPCMQGQVFNKPAAATAPAHHHHHHHTHTHQKKTHTHMCTQTPGVVTTSHAFIQFLCSCIRSQV